MQKAQKVESRDEGCFYYKRNCVAPCIWCLNASMSLPVGGLSRPASVTPAGLWRLKTERSLACLRAHCWGRTVGAGG